MKERYASMVGVCLRFGKDASVVKHVRISSVLYVKFNEHNIYKILTKENKERIRDI